MIELIRWALFILVVSMWAFYAVLMLYDVLFRPWRLVEEQIITIERNIETLKRGGWRAKLHSWISMPLWHGDVGRHLKYLLGLRELKRAELELFERLKSERR
ncbi:hypothetical protein X802_00880 [Thermococcus guaymasensis DSM 11113]|uniref:Uncharacterized protein n=1 Tax=Thermococcus guaymasensis DSM 11113 TaxID=1432656 RepID=A0A0X1KMX8_9EURY|nr:hypothetical protein [Thermococcus guaymasensis]AJC72623.1 hypothetical protein X802_00880 [Thermococcus guaymasensis DSM 11113]